MASSPQIEDSDRIHRAIFGRPVPPILKERFERASRTMHASQSQEAVTQYEYILAKVSDLESLEFAARIHKKLPMLSTKFLIMIRLAETLPEYYAQYINSDKKVLRAYLGLAFSVLRSAWLYCKGLYLLKTVRNF